MDSASFFTRRKVIFLVASLRCLLWGSAYPAIKNVAGSNLDLFVKLGDTIYADGPIRESVVAENGQPWQNIVRPEVPRWPRRWTSSAAATATT